MLRGGPFAHDDVKPRRHDDGDACCGQWIGKIRSMLSNIRDRFLGMCRYHRQSRAIDISAKWRGSRNQLVESATQTINIDASVDLMAIDCLFRCHVGQGPQKRPIVGQMAFAVDPSGQTKIDQQRLPRLIEKLLYLQ